MSKHGYFMPMQAQETFIIHAVESYRRLHTSMRNVKCVLIGNEDVDKKELLIKIASDLAPKNHEKPAPKATDEETKKDEEFLRSESFDGLQDFETVAQPTRFQVLHHDEHETYSDEEPSEEVMEYWSGAITVDGKTFNLEIHDSTCQDAFDQLRPYLYPDTDVFLVCFSVAMQNSLQDVVSKWVPEVRGYCPVTPLILVGTHTNWRELFDERIAAVDPAERPVYRETGAIYAERIGAIRYLECSTGDSEAVRIIFEEAIRISSMDRMELSQQLPDFVRFGFTLLHQAAQVNHESSVEALAYVMDINVKDRNGRSPLDVAVRQNHTECARRLIMSGCDVKLDNEDWSKRCEFWVDDGKTEPIVHRNVNELVRRLLHMYAGWENPTEANVLLIGQHGIEVGKFLRESAPFIPIKSLGIVNSEALCTFDFSQLQLSLSSLTITNCDFGGEVPFSIYELVNTESLSLVSTNISKLHGELSNLKNLQKLRLSENKLRELPDTIGRLHKLRFIHCDYNLLEYLPDQMAGLGSLEVLELTHNKLEKLSASLGLLNNLKCLKYDMNRLKFPPIDVLKKGSDAVLEYLNNFLDEPVPNKQVKFTLVGGEGVGKSTLVKALKLKKNWKFSVIDRTDKTNGIEISNIGLNESLRMKVFDLGGDVSYFDTHSLFISENSLYQATFDMSQYAVSKCATTALDQLGRVEMWLQIIFSQAPNSHIIITATNAGHPNLTDEIRCQIREDVERMLAKYRMEHKRQFGGEAVPQCVLCDGTHLCDVSSAQFYIRQHPGDPSKALLSPQSCIPHVVGYFEVSCKEPYPKVFLSSKNIGLQKLKCGLSIKMEVLLGSSVGSRIPQKCLYFRNRVLEILETDRELQEQPILTLKRLREIGCGMKDEFKLKAMLSYFHTQGEFLWFEDIPELSGVVFINPQWLSDQLRTLYPPYEGHQCIADGIIRTDNLLKLWPDFEFSKRMFLLTLIRQLGLCFAISDAEDLFPSLLPLGRPDKESWPLQPSPIERQLAVEFVFGFLPPAFFSKLIVVINKRDLVSADLGESSYYRLHLVFKTSRKATEGCVLHNRENRTSPLHERLEDHHSVHVESVPHSSTIRTTVRGPTPCCVLPEIRAAVKSVSDVHYPGVRFMEFLVCPACEVTRGVTVKRSVYLMELNEEANTCTKGHEVGRKVDLLSGYVPEDLISPAPPPRTAYRAALENGQDVLEDHFCPKLFIVLPIGFKSTPLRNCHVMSHVTDGYAVHFLCECPGYWHLVSAPGYRIVQSEQFFAAFGERVCKLLKLIFLLGDEDSFTYPSLKNFLLKIVVGDPSQRDCLADDIKDLLEHYYTLFPDLTHSISTFLNEDLEYLVSGKDLSRSKLARMIELIPEGRTFGPLVCTYVERHKVEMWLCRKHAQPIARTRAVSKASPSQPN